jgi:peptidoglycan-associated lipoprotein
MSIKTKTVLKTALVAFVLTSVAACSDKPKPVEPVPTPPVATAPEQTPAPTPTPTTPVQTGILPGTQQDFIVNVGDRVYFDTDQSSLRSDAQGVLAAQAAWLNRYPGVKIRIEGNADERGTREYNFALGARRAEAVSEFLISKGVAPARISTISYGKENPLNPGSDEDAWAQNRNAHTSLTSGAK